MVRRNPDTLVIGGGPGGAAAASFLAQAGHDVAVLDAASFPRDKTCGDALTPIGVRALGRLGVLDAVERAGAFRIERIGFRSPGGRAVRAGIAEAIGPDDYGLVMPRHSLDEVLLRRAAADGAAVIEETRATRLIWDKGRIARVEADRRHRSGTERVVFEPRHVVIATGANVGFLRRNGFTVDTRSIMAAARAYFTDVRPLAREFTLYFDADLVPGYGWVFPTGPQSANIGVGVTPASRATASTARLLEGFVERLVDTGVVTIGPQKPSIKGYPIRGDFAGGRACGPNWYLVGESAGLVNPLTGEGIDLALESGVLAAECIGTALGGESSTAGRGDYSRILSDRYRLMFLGLRLCQRFFLRPLILDRLIGVMLRDADVRHTVIRVGQGIQSPSAMIHPRLVARLLVGG